MLQHIKPLAVVAALLLTSISACDKVEDTTIIPDVLDSISCDSMPKGSDNTFLRIVAIQPDPNGIDDFRESIVLMNFHKSMRINISNYHIYNTAGVRYELTAGFANSCEKKTQTFSTLAYLNNTTDSLYLCYGSNDTLQRIGYTSTKEGEMIIVR